MCKYGVFTTLAVVVFTYEIHGDNIEKAVSKKSSLYELEYWSRDPIFQTTARRNNRRHGELFLEISSDYQDIPKFDGRRAIYKKRRAKAIRQGNRLKAGKMSATAAPLGSQELADDNMDTRRLQKKNELNNTDKQKSDRMPPEAQAQVAGENEPSSETVHRAANVPKPKNIVLSPYSLLRQIKDHLMNKFEDMDANVTIEILGRTMEYNDIIMLKATHLTTSKQFRVDDKEKYDETVLEKKIIFIVHGLTITGFRSLPCLSTVKGLQKLISYYYKYLEYFDIYLIPMANPDGRSKTDTAPYWNKNMSPQSACPGVCLDRNFDVAWNDSSSISSCNQLYPGKIPFSEMETLALKEVFHKYSHRMMGYFHVHAATYSEQVFKGDGVLYPKGYTDSNSDDDKYIDMRAEIEEAMKNASFKVYAINVGTLHNWYGTVTGASVDYASHVYGVPFALELAMQLFTDDMMVDNSEERETSIVLSEVWERVIDVIFKFMHKTLKTTEKK